MSPQGQPHLRRAFADDPIAEFADQPTKALIGVRRVGDTDFQAVKLSWRKNLDGGCVLKRACLCDAASSVGERTPPVPPRRIWPLIRSRIGAGELLFPWYTKNNINRPLRGYHSLMGLARQRIPQLFGLRIQPAAKNFADSYRLRRFLSRKRKPYTPT